MGVLPKTAPLIFNKGESEMTMQGTWNTKARAMASAKRWIQRGYKVQVKYIKKDKEWAVYTTK